MATKSQDEKPSEKKEKAPESSSVTLKNLTNQKQIIEVDGESYVLLASSKLKVELSKADAETKFKFWVESNLVTIS